MPQPARPAWAAIFRSRSLVAGATLLLAGLLVLVALTPGPLTAQEAASVRLEPETARIGERVTLTIEVPAPSGSLVELDLGNTSLGGAEVAESLPVLTRAAGDSTIYILRFVLTAFTTGTIEVRPAVLVTPAGGDPQSLALEPAGWQVVSVLPEGEPPTEIRDLQPQLAVGSEGFPYLTEVIVLGSIAAVVLIAFAGYRLARYVLPKLRKLRPEPEVPVEVLVQRELDALAQMDPHPDQLPAIYSRLALAIRKYLSGVYDFPAYALTTSELRRQMEDHGVHRWQARLVAGLLSECDAVTYASYRPAVQRVKSDVQMAYEIVTFDREREGEAVAVS